MSTRMSFDMSRKFYVMTETNIMDTDTIVVEDTEDNSETIEEDEDIVDVITNFRMEVKDYMDHNYCVILNNRIDELVDLVFPI
jgi:hypothetical protein